MCFFNFPNKTSVKARLKGIEEFECGHCPECLQKKSRLWALRTCMQAKVSDGVMVTLTYDTYKYDYTKSFEENPTDPTIPLSKRDCQLFIKRLRKHFSNDKIKYLLTAERGKRTNRAHYHALLFGVKFDDLVKYKKSDRGNWIYKSRTLEKIWKKGICTVDCINLSAKTARYCTKYCAKDSGADDTFMLFSRGIGEELLLKLFNGKSYWIDGREYPIPKQIWQKVIENDYDIEGYSRYIPRHRLENIERIIYNDCKRRKDKEFKLLLELDMYTRKHSRKARIYDDKIDALTPRQNYLREKYTRLRDKEEIKIFEKTLKINSYIEDSQKVADVKHYFLLNRLTASNKDYEVGKAKNEFYQNVRDEDSRYIEYLEYWHKKAQEYEFSRPTVEERILSLPNSKYWSYKQKAIRAKEKQVKSFDFVPPRSNCNAFIKFHKPKEYQEKAFAPLTRHYRANDTISEDNLKLLKVLRRENLLAKPKNLDPILERDIIKAFC